MSLEALREALDGLPVGIYRAKGIVHIDGIEDRQVIAHVVGKRIYLEQGEPWPEGPRRSRMVAIGAKGSFEPEAVRQALSACEVEPGRGVGRTLLSWVRRLRK